MMKWIRWQGVVAFAAVTGLIALVWFIYIDRWVENYIERVGTLIVGAKVELDKADVSLFPLGITLTRMQVTHPDKPMVNAVDVRRIAFLLEAPQLLLRKTIINEMSIDDMEFGTQRKYSGAAKRDINSVVPKPLTDFVAKQMGPVEFPAIEVPDVMEILKREDLASIRLVETIRAEIETEREAWQKRIKELPNEKTFNEYKARVEKIKKGVKAGTGGALVAATEVTKLPQEIRREIDKIESAKNELVKTLELVQKRADEASKAPFEDIERLKDKYNLSGKGLANLTSTFLGPQYASYLSQLFMWHARIAPYLEKKEDDPKEKKPERGKGVDIRFKEHRPLPEFLIKKSGVTLKVDEVGSFKGEARNITGQQPVWGQPLTIKLEGDKLETVIRTAALDMQFNRVRPSDPKDTIALSASGLMLKGLPLSKHEKWPILLKRAEVSARIQMDFFKDHVNGLISAGMAPIEIVTGFDDVSKNPVKRAVAATLAEVKTVAVDAEVRGNPENYDLFIKSNLDEILQKALDRIVKETVAEFEKRLKAEIMKRVEKPLAEIRAKMNDLGAHNPQLDRLSKEGQRILDEALKTAGGSKIPLPGDLKVPKLFGK